MNAIGNELFRFVAVRPVPRDAVELGDEATLPVPGSVTITGADTTPLVGEAAILAAEGRPREARSRLATTIASDEFQASVSALLAEWRPVADRLHYTAPTDSAALAGLLRELRRGDPDVLAAAPGFRRSVATAQAALAAALVVAPARTQLIAALVRIFRTLTLIDGAARDAAALDSRAAIRAALRRPILISNELSEVAHGLSVDDDAGGGDGTARPVDPAPATGRDRASFGDIYGALRVLSSVRSDQLTLIAASDSPPVRADGSARSAPPRMVFAPFRTRASLRVDSISARNEAPLIVLTASAVEQLPRGVVDVLAAAGIDPRRAPVSQVRQALEVAAREAYAAERSRTNDRSVHGATAHFYSATAGYQYTYGTYGTWPPPATQPADGGGSAPGAMPSPAIRVVGIADLIIARQERVQYVASEVAHIQNLLDGEAISRVHRRLNRAEEITLREAESTKEKELDLQTTEKFELEQEVATTISESQAIDVGVNIAASYGPYVSVDSHFGYTSESSLQRSERTATNYSTETMQRAVQRIKERVRELRERRVLEEIEETNSHSLSSPPGRGNVSGTYQFVDKIYENRLYNYGKRLLMEVTVPEPGAYLRHLRSLGLGIQPPEPFDLSVADVDELTYLEHARRWDVTDLEPPPDSFLVVPHAVKLRVRDGVANYTARIEIPDGYQVTFALAAVHAGANHSAWTSPSSHDPGFSAGLRMSLSGLYFYNIAYSGRQAWPPALNGLPPGDDLRRGALPLTIGLLAEEAAYPEVDIGIALVCAPSAERKMKWRIATYAALLAGFERLRARYEEQRATAEISGGVQIAGDNPAVNRARERRELKRAIIETLRAQHLGSQATMTANPTIGGHRLIDFAATSALTPLIRYFESVFDWENVTYTLHPYFWAQASQWDQLNAEREPDPLFMHFLQAGAATVRLPVQRGEEGRALYFLDFAAIWDQDDPPPHRAEREPIIAITQTFEASLEAAPNGVPFGTAWLTRIPTSLVTLAAQQGLPAGWISLTP